MLSDTSFSSLIRSWRKARLDTGNAALDYPRINILEKARMGSRRTGATPIGDTTDADRVQIAVLRLPDPLRRVFEAYHLALIDEKRYTGIAHELRANVLGLAKSTYWYRVNASNRAVNMELEEIIDKLDDFS